MAETECEALASTQFGLVTLRQAKQRGMTDRAIEVRLRSGKWVEPFPRVFQLASADDWKQRAMGATLATGGFLASEAAARLHGLDDFDGESVHVVTRRQPKAYVRGAVIRSRNSVEDIGSAVVDGISVLSVEATLIDLAGMTSTARLEFALESALRQGKIQLEPFRETVAKHGVGRPGAEHLAKLLADRPKEYRWTESKLEVKTRQVLRAARLFRFEQQHQVFEGTHRLDFAFVKRQVGIEADGYEFHGGRLAWQQGLMRDRKLICADWRILHVSDEDVDGRPDEIVEQIRAVLGCRRPFKPRGRYYVPEEPYALL